jgi:hypothetical protein
MGENEKEARFLPFNAINEFMRDDYRLQVIKTTLIALPSLPEEHQKAINRLTRRHVQVPGFRNSVKAPVPLRAKSSVEAFEKNHQFCAAILSGWSESRSELRQLVYDLMIERGWDVLPAEADRARLPGFALTWPEEENFEVFNAAFLEKYPNVDFYSDDISLMVVWLSARLPYQADTEGENNEEPMAE